MVQGRTIEHRGVVTRLFENSAEVSFIRESACAGCHAKKLCTQSDQQQRTVIATVPKELNIKEGDSVKVLLRLKLGFKALLYAFIIPLVLLFVVLFLSSAFVSEGVAALFVILALSLWYFVMYLLRDRLFSDFVLTIESDC